MELALEEIAAETPAAMSSRKKPTLDATMGHLTELGIEELTATPASLEDMFLREYQGELR